MSDNPQSTIHNPQFSAAAALLILTLGQAAVPVTDESRHRVVFTNRYVRVIDAALPVGDTTLFHTHDLDNVPIVIAGGTIRTQVVAGATTDTRLDIGQAWLAKAAYTHQIANVGTTPLRFIDAEILSRWNGTASGPVSDAIRQEAPIVENDIVRVARITLAANGRLTAHVHARPVLHVEVSGGTEQAARRVPGSFTWIDPGGNHAVPTSGDRPYEAIVVEWK
jgi:quercetin dioxygenase-like cupin family protein